MYAINFKFIFEEESFQTYLTYISRKHVNSIYCWVFFFFWGGGGIFLIFLLKLVYLRKYSNTVRANFVVFQNPGWDFPTAWVEFSKTLGGIFKTLGGVFPASSLSFNITAFWNLLPGTVGRRKNSTQGFGKSNPGFRSTQGFGKFHPGFWKIPPRV